VLDRWPSTSIMSAREEPHDPSQREQLLRAQEQLRRSIQRARELVIDTDHVIDELNALLRTTEPLPHHGGSLVDPSDGRA
jgi:hypothetical protein